MVVVEAAEQVQWEQMEHLLLVEMVGQGLHHQLQEHRSLELVVVVVALLRAGLLVLVEQAEAVRVPYQEL
jgi:hypothetical protein